MAFKMTAAEVPVALIDAITMTIDDLEMVINGQISTCMRLTRSTTELLKLIFEARLDHQFDYQEFQSEVDDNVIILMNEIIKSPQYWCETDIEELR